MNILARAAALPDRNLLARLPVLAAHERTATAELVAHLAALRLRPSLYAAQGYGSLFAYCRNALRLSEDAASNRIHAARACLKFPAILDLLASGELSLSAVRMLRPHLTAENHEGVLARARNARRVDVEKLVAELAPRPDVPSSVRKMRSPGTSEAGLAIVREEMQRELPTMPGDAAGAMPRTSGLMAGTSDLMPGSSGPMPAINDTRPTSAPIAASTEDLATRSAYVPRPVVQPLSPGRYRVQFTIGEETHDVLRRLQTFLRRDIADGDAGAIFERALRLLHEEVEAEKFGRATQRGSAKRPLPARHRDGAKHHVVADRARHAKPAAHATNRAYEKRIRPGADFRGGSRYIPRAVKRAVWYRDRGQCAFVAASGRRCGEQAFLELHHIQPYALNGPPTAGNIALRCRRHNAYEAEMVFGPRVMPPPPR